MFLESPMKNIYDKGALEIQTSISALVVNNLDFYGSIGFRHAWGHALNLWEKTRLIVVPCDI